MGRETGIEWADATWNPAMGCTKVSEGCAHCYAEAFAKRQGWDFRSVHRSKTTFDAPLLWARNTVYPVEGPPFRIFVCSLSDFFHPAVDDFRREIWQIIAATKGFNVVYLILTKRPERIEAHLPTDWGTAGWPNVWLGVSVENQERAVERIPQLTQIPARVHFLSCEPLLGPLNLLPYLLGIQWVIVGGESGFHARKMDPAWAGDIRFQCKEFSVPFFFKQLGGRSNKRAHDEAILDGLRWTEVPSV